MKVMLQATLAAGLVAAISLNAFAANQPEGRRDIARYEKAAGQSVTEMPLPSVVDWQALDDQSVAVWTANDKPWLVHVQTPCDVGLKTAENIAFTSGQGTVKAGTDYLEVGSQRCKVASIQPVDYQQIAQASRPHSRTPRHSAKMKAAEKSGA